MSSSKDLTTLVHTKIIDIILASPLNIESIPDDIERELYEKIFVIIDDFILTLQPIGFITKIFNWFK